jgi:hypothetical protein
MLIGQSAQSEVDPRQGSRATILDELQADREAPRVPAGIHQQCLLNLADRLARVQALGDEYARVGFSPQVEVMVSQLSA